MPIAKITGIQLNQTVIPFSELNNGQFSIKLTDSNGTELALTLSLKLEQINTAPTVEMPVPDIFVDEDASPYTIDLSTVFADRETLGTNLIYSLIDNTNPSLVKTTLDGKTLVLNFNKNSYGKADIVIGCDDLQGLTVTDIFTVNVKSVNDAPEIINPIKDVQVSEDSAVYPINLLDAFKDVDDNSDGLIFSITNNTNTSIVSTSIDNKAGILSLLFAKNAFGLASITVRGTDTQGLYIEDTFNVIVDAINDSPVIINPIQNIFVDMNSPNTVINLSNVFYDTEDTSDKIIFSVLKNDNVPLLSTSIDKNVLTLAYMKDKFGVSNIIVRATDSNGSTVDCAFSVTVKQIAVGNTAPVVSAPIADINTFEDSPTVSINLWDVFADKETLDNALVYTVVRNSNWHLITPSINPSTGELKLFKLPNAFGIASITIRAKDAQGLTAEDTFVITVAGINDVPVVTSPIADVKVLKNASATVIDLYAAFIDVEDSSDQLQYVVQSNTNTALVTTSIRGGKLTLNYARDKTGTAVITIKATDKQGASVQDAFNVTVS